MILISCPQLVVTIIVCIVSSYLGYKMVQIKKSVTPTVNISPSCISNKSVTEHKANSSRSVKKVRRIDDQPNMFYTVDVVIEENETETKDRIPQKSERTTSNRDLNKNQIFLMAKTALNMNYIVIFDCIINTPLSIMTIIYLNCDNDIGDCDVFLLFNKIMIAPRLLTICAGFVIFFYKIRHGET